MFLRAFFCALICIEAVSYAQTEQEINFAGVQVLPFSLPWMNHQEKGKIFNSDDFPGTVYLFEAYFQTCTYCNQNAPNVKKLAEHYKDTPKVKIIDLGRDSRTSDYETWIKRHNPEHPVLNDGRLSIIKKLNTRSYPSTYLVGCDGFAVLHSQGLWSTGKVEYYIQEIDKLLAEDSCQSPN